MRNWQTTIIGAVLAASVALNDFLLLGKDLTDWKSWIVPVLIAVFGYVAKDAKQITEKQ
jgi:hypothetical protein